MELQHKLKKVFTCVPVCPGQGVVAGLVELLLQLKNDVGVIRVSSFLDRKTSRNILRTIFLQSSYEYMLTFDSDVVPLYKPLLSMIEEAISRERKFTSGAVPFFRGKEIHWMVFKKKDGEFDLFEGLKEPKIYEVDAAGLGCALISRDILEKIYFSDRYDKNGMIYRTDDLDFLNKFNIWVIKYILISAVNVTI